jgi:formylglycine-generating enzyme required for sulfatase activity
VTLKDANYYDSNIKTKISAWSKFGQDFIYDDLLARCRLKTVGSYKANAFGLYDMHGNVSEWCEDWHGRYPSGPVIDPKGAETGKGRILRGGSFNANDLEISSVSRDKRYVPTNRHCTYGFRIVKTQLP